MGHIPRSVIRKSLDQEWSDLADLINDKPRLADDMLKAITSARPRHDDDLTVWLSRARQILQGLDSAELTMLLLLAHQALGEGLDRAVERVQSAGKRPVEP